MMGLASPNVHADGAFDIAIGGRGGKVEIDVSTGTPKASGGASKLVPKEGVLETHDVSGSTRGSRLEGRDRAAR